MEEWDKVLSGRCDEGEVVLEKYVSCDGNMEVSVT